MADDARSRFIEAATRQFADKGFYGASVSSIAGEIGVSKQAVLHHFGTKERLYGEVLQKISDRLLSRVIQDTVGAGSETRLEHLLVSLYDDGVTYVQDMQLLVRELLDNRRRSEQARSWYLKPFLDALIGLVQRTPGWEATSDAQALAAVYQLLGAITYFTISQPTLVRMFGKHEYGRLEAAFPVRLRALIRATLATPPSTPS
ncbi:MAG: TetR/AcrR family transcriptional regulator [Myxococcales bacterium]|nr:TetR/AcrR family transcriptional regulator [Myxococcales bacterium]